MTSRATWTTVLAGLVLAGCAGNTLEAPKVRPSRSDQAAKQSAKGTQAAPGTQDSESYQVVMETSQGKVVIEVIPEWAPLGAARFRELVEDGFFDGCRFFRVVPNFVVQFGINGDPAVHSKWDKKISDDPVTQSNKRGTLTFATSGPNTRTSQLFINLKDNSGSLDGQGFSPFGRIVSGMEAVDKITSEYGERPQQPLIEQQGNVYLEREFPNMDYVKTAKVEGTDKADKADKTDKTQN